MAELELAPLLHPQLIDLFLDLWYHSYMLKFIIEIGLIYLGIHLFLGIASFFIDRKN